MHLSAALTAMGQLAVSDHPIFKLDVRELYRREVY